MSDFDKAKIIKGMNIMKSRKKCDFLLSQYSYLKKVVEWFRKHDAKTINNPLDPHTKL